VGRKWREVADPSFVEIEQLERRKAGKRRKVPEAPQPQAQNVVSPDEGGHPARVAAPREGSKLALVIEHLQRADGATIVDLSHASGWLPHTTRAALTGLRKRGYAVIRERIGAGDSVCRISDAPAHRGDRTVRRRDAMDSREPKQKATQAA
jgi:hypothetical protein